jgi:hypothetical protein
MLLLLILLAVLNVGFCVCDGRSRTCGSSAIDRDISWIDVFEAVLANTIFIAASSLVVHWLFRAPAPLTGDAAMVASALSAIMLMSALMQKFGPSESKSSRQDYVLTIGIIFVITTWAALGFSTLLPATMRLTAGKRLAELIVIVALYPATIWFLKVVPICFWFCVSWFDHTARNLNIGRSKAMAVFNLFKGALELYKTSPQFATASNREAVLTSAEFNMECAEKGIQIHDWNAVLFFSRQGMDQLCATSGKVAGKNPARLC